MPSAHFRYFNPWLKRDPADDGFELVSAGPERPPVRLSAQFAAILENRYRAGVKYLADFHPDYYIERVHLREGTTLDGDH